MRVSFLFLFLVVFTGVFAQSHNWFPHDVAEKKASIRKQLADRKMPDALAVPLTDCLMQKILVKCPRREMFGEVFKDPSVMKGLVEQCRNVITDYVMTTKDTSLKFGSLVSEASIMVKACVDSYDSTQTKLKIRPQVYCECMVTEFMRLNVPVTALQDVFNENSMIHNELYLPCIQKAAIKGVRNVGFDRDSIVLPLIKANNSFKVKGILPNKESKYFIIDSGADYVFISEEDEKKLIESGVLKNTNYLDKINVVLGNGSEVTAQTFLSTLTLGNKEYKDVIYSVIKDCPVPLLGKSFLDKFSAWSINNQRNQLVLIP
jgi:hypothetical protein